MTEKALFDLEIEKEILGQMIVDNSVIHDIADLIKTEEVFYGKAHQIIYKTILEVYNSKGDFDLTLLVRELKDKNLLDKVGGAGYIAELTNSASSLHIEEKAKYLYEKYVRRKLNETLIQFANRVQSNQGEDVFNAIDELNKTIANFLPANGDVKHINQALDEFKDILQDYKLRKNIKRISTGFYDLDKLTGGLNLGSIVIIAGRPSMGKTTLLFDIIFNVISEGIGCLLFSLEINTNTILEKFIGKFTGIDFNQLHSGRFKYEDATMALSNLFNKNFYVSDSLTSPGKIINTIRKYVKEKDIKVVAIDYLQLINIRVSKNQTREIEVGKVVEMFKRLANELNIVIILLSQLSRAVEARHDKVPVLSDLRDSGRIEEHADVVLMLYRPSYYSESENKNIAELYVRKNRYGQTGVVKLAYDSVKGFGNLMLSVDEEYRF